MANEKKYTIEYVKEQGIYKNIPKTELMQIFSTVCGHSPPSIIHTPELQYKWYIDNGYGAWLEQIAIASAFNKLNNIACHTCLKKHVTITCRTCQITFWCSGKCLNNDKSNHDKWCGIEFGEPDSGPTRIIIVQPKNAGDTFENSGPVASVLVDPLKKDDLPPTCSGDDDD
jgi:hypothetical protein